MPKMRKSRCSYCYGKRFSNDGEGERVRLHQGVYWMAAVLSAWHPVRPLWHGQDEENHHGIFQGYQHMQKLWIQILNQLQWIGDHSGCHQRPERSFRIGDYVFPVCARCTGVAVGQAAALIALLAGLRLSWPLCLVLLLPMGADWGIQELGIHPSSNGRRLVTGILGGFGLFMFYGWAAIKIFT